MSARCSTCGRPIVWAITAKGKRMPVDAEPHPDGNVVLVDEDTTLRAVVLSSRQTTLDERFSDAPRYRSHFATCPQAGIWRR